jgi:hypothetical protein
MSLPRGRGKEGLLGGGAIEDRCRVDGRIIGEYLTVVLKTEQRTIYFIDMSPWFRFNSPFGVEGPFWWTAIGERAEE